MATPDDEVVDEELVSFEDWVEDDDQESIKSLFSEEMYATVIDMIRKDKQFFAFDLEEAVYRYCKEFQDVIMMVNFIRSKVNKEKSTIDRPFILNLLSQIHEGYFRDNSEYMQPVIENDSLLYLLQDALTSVNPAKFVFLCNKINLNHPFSPTNIPPYYPQLVPHIFGACPQIKLKKGKSFGLSPY